MMFSIVIVNYKVPELLERCISRLYDAQSTIEREVIVVDNASRDHSRELILSRFPDVKWIQNTENLGFAKAVNIGLKNAQGNCLLLLNPDTELSPDALRRCQDFFVSHPDAGIVGGKILNTDGTIQPQCRRKIPTPGAAFFRLFGLHRLLPSHRLSQQYELPLTNLDSVHEVEAVSGSFLCTTRDVIDQIAGLDEGFFLYGEDLDFCYRVTKAGFKIYFVPDIIVLHHRGASREKLPIRSLWHIHYAMHRFYKKHQATNHSILFNTIIYSMIWLRWFGLLVFRLSRA